VTFDELFELKPAGAGQWIAPGAPQTDERRLFGGLLIGQAIVSASKETRRCHALHAFFIGVGGMQEPFEIDVEPTRDGGSFATRRVEIRHRQKLLLAAYSSHHDGDSGPDNQVAMPRMPAPEDLEDQRITRGRRAEGRSEPARRYLAEDLLDARPVELPPLPPGSDQPGRAIWFRPRQPIRGGVEMHQAAIGFASDLGLVHVGLLAHFRASRFPVQSASLDHSIWFHREASANDWMLHVQSARVAAVGRGLSQSAIYTRDGRLVASASQEFLARRQREKSS
jgi:acyl-CoA thioesterase-2